MRSVLAVGVGLALLLAVPGLAQNTNFYQPPVTSVPKVKVAPTVDGILAPGEWTGAVQLPPFVALGGKALPQYATDVWVAYDDHCLYVGALLHDPNPAGLKADTTDRDGPVWADDDLELFFDTEDQRKGYIHLAVNPKERQYDALGKDKAADYRWTARAATLSNGWSVELQLPFANDYPPAPGIAWGFAVGRHVASTNEYSNWVRCDKSFHELANFGSIVFNPSPLVPELLNLGGLWLGDNTMQAAIRNQTGVAATGKVNVRVMGRDRAGTAFGTTKVSVAPGGRQALDVAYRVPQDGFSTVAFSLTDATGKTIWRTSPYPVISPEVEPRIAAVEKTLGTALREWMTLPAGAGKDALRADLDALMVQWRYVVSQYRERAKLPREELQALADYAGRLEAEANTLSQRVRTAKMTGQTDARFALTAVPDLVNVTADQAGLPLVDKADLRACRNETEAVQVVVLPFR